MPSRKGRLVLLRILALIFVIGLTILIFVFREEINKFKAYGYPGIFLVTLLANATVLIPAPGVAFVLAMGAVLNPFLVALAACLGGTIGEISGYLAGFSGQAIVENTKVFRKIEPFVQKYGVWAILILAAIPNPIFDLAGIAAGGSKIPLSRFLLFCSIGQFIKMLCFSMAGYYSLNWIIDF